VTPYDGFRSGVGPEPRSFQVGRDYTPPAVALDKTRYCPVHGTVLWRGQPCPDCKGGKR
jgi:hypothetical protein